MTEPPPPVDISVHLTQKPAPKVPVLDETEWKEDEELTAAFRELQTKEAIDLGEGVQVIPSNWNFLQDQSGASSHLVTRQEQRNVIDYAFMKSRENLSMQEFFLAIRGSPGIGKSRSALLYIRKLMQQATARRPIILEFGKSQSRKTYLIMPPEGKEPSQATNSDGTSCSESGNVQVEKGWIAYRLLRNKVPEKWIDCPIIDFVIDPAQFSRGESPSPSALAEAAGGHCFIPVSPDDRHLGGAHKTASYLLQLVMGPWTLKELEKGFPYMMFANPTYTYTHSRQDFEDAMSIMRENYYILGGLPRYLVKGRADSRKAEITPAKAATHSQELLDALVAGEQFNDSTTDKILTRFFTLRAGEDKNGYNPDRLYATLDFVSPGAAKAAGKIILTKIHKDATWRGQDDASDIGLAFERIVLIFLSQGTQRMKRLGIRTRCRQLMSKKNDVKRLVTDLQAALDSQASQPVSFVLHTSSDNIEQASDSSAFEEEVRRGGKGVTYQQSKLESRRKVSLPPDGYCNFDAMAGADLGFNATLQKSHTISGPEFIRQKRAYGLGRDDYFMHVFVVPTNRFNKGWTACQQFQWSGNDDEATTNRKRRRVKQSSKVPGQTGQAPQKQITENEKKEARDSMYQFVLTLEIEEEEEEHADADSKTASCGQLGHFAV